MKDKRKPGLSLLDYLWANYGEFSVSTTPSDDPDAILTLDAINSLLLEFSGVKSVKVIEHNGTKLLEVITSDDEYFTYPLPRNISIQSFTRRQVTQADRNKGCELPLNSWCYSILLTDGNEYLAPIDKYSGSSLSILLDILENVIYAEVKISNRPSIVSMTIGDDGLYSDLNISENSSIDFLKLEDGLSGHIVLENSDKFVKFSLLTAELYLDLLDSLLVDETTMYFIRGKRYFYFGTYKMGGSSESVDLDEYYTKLLIDKKLQDFVTKDELQRELDKNMTNWINI